MQHDALTRRLEALDTARLAELLRRRPDVVTPEPHGLSELAARLVLPASLTTVLQQLSVPSWQLLEAALALGEQPSTTDLVALLDLEHAERGDVDDIVGTLHDLAVLTREDTALHLPDTMRRIFPNPLGLGEPMAVLLERATADALRQVARNLGLERPRTRADAERALTDFFADPANVEQLVADVPDGIRSALHDLESAQQTYAVFDPDAYTAQLDVQRWAVPRGLAVDVDRGYEWRVPAEVTRVLRGPAYRAPFDPHPPIVRSHSAPSHSAPSRSATSDDVDSHTRESAVAATAFLAALLAVLDHLARHPLKALKSGGVGARELAKLAKVTQTSETTPRLALELADALGLLDVGAAEVTVSPAMAAWRDQAPEVQFAAVVRTWWTLGTTPTVDRDPDGKSLRALVSGTDQPCDLCRLARHVLLDVLSEVGATDRRSAALLVLWRRPAAHLSPPDDPLADQWREAELLGVIADGAVTPLGLALRANADTQDVDIQDVARTLLPAAATHATFGSDLTAFVAGSPAARVSAVLDSAADREGRGGAITWRFGPASVRRAFDEGASAETLLADLADVAQAELPQALRFLINDVARRHGSLQLSSATSVIRSADAALLALVAADRTLAKHGVRLLAPTVLAADVPVDTMLAALRSAGYFPVIEGPGKRTPDAAAIRATQRLAGNNVLALPVRAAPEPDWLAVAKRIASGRPSASAAAVSLTTVKALTRLNATLSMAELRQLAQAVDQQGRIGIEYLGASGRMTRRVIRSAEFLGPSLFAWCELRREDREFLVGRIVSVYVAP